MVYSIVRVTSDRTHTFAASVTQPGALTISQVPLDRVPWAELDRLPDRLVTQTRAWLDFLRASQRAEPVIGALHFGDGNPVGYFTGLVTRRFGVRMLGSPLPGWTTAYQGFNLIEPIARADAVTALTRFAFGPLRCHHLELRDRFLTTPPADPRLHREEFVTYDIDLTPAEEEIFASFSSACRRAIRKAEKVGVQVEEASPAGFAAEYFAQLEEVFAKQGLRPTYDVQRVEQLIRHLAPTGALLLLRARDADGSPIATGLFPGHATTAFFWGGASRQSGQQNRPNEAIMWHAIRAWKARGATTLDLGGGGDYKRKYAGTDVAVPHLARSRVEVLWRGREWMRRRNDPDNPGGRFRAHS